MRMHLRKATTLIGFVPLVLVLSSCNQRPYYNSSVAAYFNPQLDISNSCPTLILKVDPPGGHSISLKSDAKVENRDYASGYAGAGFPIHSNGDIFQMTYTLQCIEDGKVVGESIRHSQVSTSALDKNRNIHISAPKPNQAYIGTYISRTGLAPVIEIGAEITVVIY